VAGFCLFNNVAIAIKHAQKEHGVKKICVFDWDIHVGDGTSKTFYEDDSVLFISLHRYDEGYFYPGSYGTPTLTGKGKGEGFNIHYGFSALD
jgi:acetoin utilization deacetylase AcuC-like enzyme